MKILLQCLINKKTLPNVHLISIIREMHNTEANCDCIDHRIWGKNFKIKEDMHFFCWLSSPQNLKNSLRLNYSFKISAIVYRTRSEYWPDRARPRIIAIHLTRIYAIIIQFGTIPLGLNIFDRWSNTCETAIRNIHKRKVVAIYFYHTTTVHMFSFHFRIGPFCRSCCCCCCCSESWLPHREKFIAIGSIVSR